MLSAEARKETERYLEDAEKRIITLQDEFNTAYYQWKVEDRPEEERILVDIMTNRLIALQDAVETYGLLKKELES